MNLEEVFKEARVLLVDDNQMNLYALNTLLEGLGVLADCVPSGNATIKKCSKKQYDLIFMDHMMPEPDGVKTLEILRENPDFNTPVIVLTSNTGDNLEEYYKSVGFAEYMKKPAGPDRVRELLIKYLVGEESNAGPIEESATELPAENNESAAGDEVKENAKYSDPKLQKLVDYGFTFAPTLYKGGIMPDAYEEMLEIFLEESLDKIESCQQFYDENNLKDYAIIVHGLKNDAAMISDESLSAHAKEHELESKAGNAEFVKTEWQKLKAHWEETINRIQKYFE